MLTRQVFSDLKVKKRSLKVSYWRFGDRMPRINQDKSASLHEALELFMKPNEQSLNIVTVRLGVMYTSAER